jgi:FKBP-type peptidyl-prolyl cis-trans isomerase 2
MSRKARNHATQISNLKVRKNRKVLLHYRVVLTNGEEFDSSHPECPLEIVCGRGDTIQGLEKRILGMEPGESREFLIPPEEAFGPYDASLLQRMTLDELPEHVVEPANGLVFPLRSKGTEVAGRIVDVTEEAVTADFNHPLAGQALNYHVHIVAVDEVVPESFN